MSAHALRHGGSQALFRGSTGGKSRGIPLSKDHFIIQMKSQVEFVHPYKTNPAHNPKSSRFNPRKSVEPADAKAVYEKAKRTGMGTWWGRATKGLYYRFFSDNAGTVHFSGSFTKKQYQQLK